jgi:chromosome segregation ATPase
MVTDLKNARSVAKNLEVDLKETKASMTKLLEEVEWGRMAVGDHIRENQHNSVTVREQAQRISEPNDVTKFLLDTISAWELAVEEKDSLLRDAQQELGRAREQLETNRERTTELRNALAEASNELDENRGRVDEGLSEKERLQSQLITAQARSLDSQDEARKQRKKCRRMKDTTI